MTTTAQRATWAAPLQIASQDVRGRQFTLCLTIRGQSVVRKYYSGQPWQLGTARYWSEIAINARAPLTYQLGRHLNEECAAAVLGGFGMPASLAMAAYEQVRQAGLLHPEARPSVTDLEDVLCRPLNVDGHVRRYRFPHQRAKRLASVLAHLRQGPAPQDPLALREWLLHVPGVGPKTASWIVRNHLGSDSVAIVDVHLVRAGLAAGVFDPGWRLPRDYEVFEQAFLQWAEHSEVSAALLDATIWGALASAGELACDILGVTKLGQQPMPVWPCG